MKNMDARRLPGEDSLEEVKGLRIATKITSRISLSDSRCVARDLRAEFEDDCDGHKQYFSRSWR